MRAGGRRPASGRTAPGYENGVSQRRPVRSEIQAAASAAARHGLSTVQTFPKSALSAGRPSQK